MSVATLAEPSYLWIPDGASFAAGDEAADLARQLGFQVDQPEIDVLRALLAEGPDGNWVGLESAVVCGRQNIKTWALMVCALYDAYVRDVKRVTWSAHLFKTTTDAFREIRDLIDAHDWMRARVKKVRETNGKEGFEFTNGAQFDFMARSNKGGRGLAGDTVILDEALFLSTDMQGALIPTLSSRPNPHVLYGSSPGILTSRALRHLRNRGRAMNDDSLTYIEYTSERGECGEPECDHGLDREGCQLDDETKWAQANPALDRRITREYVRDERRALAADPVQFMRERMGWWEDPPNEDDADPPIPPESWLLRLDGESTISVGSKIAVAVDTSWGRQTTWIAVAGLTDAGVPHVEVVARDYGPSWVTAWLAEFNAIWHPMAIGLQAGNVPVGSLVEPLQSDFGDLVRPLTGIDVGRACGFLYDTVLNGPLVHIGQEQLDTAVSKAVIRPMGDGAWVWDRKASPVDIAPLVAATEALYLLMTAPTVEEPELYIAKRLR